MKFTATLLALASVASAHFTLDFPQTRGFDEDLEPNFCGGFNLSSTRVPFPLSGGPILIDSHHPSADVAILISFNSDPTSFAQFNTTPSGQTYGLLKPFGTITGLGEFCFNVNVSALGLSSVSNGTAATIQVAYNGGDGALYQCSDVVLSSTYVPTNVSCVNTTASSSSSSAGASGSKTASGTAATASATTKSGSGRTTGELGLVGLVGAVLGGAVALVL
ncbi:hypothetical protein T439DRAFT_321645 [Meredithblackwellia eburnea MCA 4105]